MINKATKRIIKRLESQKADIDRAIEIISSIPLNVILMITYRLSTWVPQKRHRETIEMKIAVKGIAYNEGSLRCEMIAVERNDMYPFNSNREQENKLPIKYTNILKWEVLKSEDLPLLIGFDRQYDLFSELISNAEIKASGKSEVPEDDDSFFKLNTYSSAILKVG